MQVYKQWGQCQPSCLFGETIKFKTSKSHQLWASTKNIAHATNVITNLRVNLILFQLKVLLVKVFLNKMVPNATSDFSKFYHIEIANEA